MSSHNPDTPLYSIGSAARMLNVSVQTLRLYENEGLIVPRRTIGGHRFYSDADIERLECIRKAINEEKISINGMKRIHAMIPCWDIIKCSEQERAGCTAYKGHSGGCWTYNHTITICAGKDCRLCEVYKLSSNCERIKEAIVCTSTGEHIEIT